MAELINASGAEIVTMQEGYGSQEYIAAKLGMNCQTCAPKANLALLSLYPVEKIETSRTFNSNPGIITLPSGQKVLVNDLWLMYAWKHCYTENPIDQGHNIEDWIAEDKELGEKDLIYILENDTNPHAGNIDDIILSGDFNSCSHLDWTDPSLHYGYGPVDFPISRLALSNGFADCFREANPDEKLRSEGTWAVIYGHLHNCRIDFTYHRGPSLRTVSSKIIRTAPQIDDIWPSDHAAVFTIFEIKKNKND
ncbi:MAG: endonuclease/exonuclease/phosphatase family protein [Candidatus Cryptobacteroides sp.]